MGNPVGWFEIYVGDMARARNFYESVFGVTLQSLGVDGLEMLAFPSDMGIYGASGALVKTEHVQPGGNSTLVYFACEDCAVEAGRVTAAGGRLFRDKFPIGEHGFCALAYDPEGNLIGLHSR